MGTNTSSVVYAVYAPVAGGTITFNSQGYFYATKSYVASFGSNKGTFSIKAGHFAAKSKYMFYNNGAKVTTSSYVSTATSTSNKNLHWMNAYNSTTYKSTSGFYGVNIGIK